MVWQQASPDAAVRSQSYFPNVRRIDVAAGLCTSQQKTVSRHSPLRVCLSVAELWSPELNYFYFTQSLKICTRFFCILILQKMRPEVTLIHMSKKGAAVSRHCLRKLMIKIVNNEFNRHQTCFFNGVKHHPSFLALLRVAHVQ